MSYVYEFLYRGRDPTNEKGKQPAWHVSVGEWIIGFDGVAKFHETGAITPARAAELGFTLDKILGEVAAAAVATADIAKADAAAKGAELEAAKADWTQMTADLRAAEDAKAAAERVAGAALQEKQALAADLSAAMARIDELQEPDEGPANLVLNKLSFGLLGN